MPKSSSLNFLSSYNCIVVTNDNYTFLGIANLFKQGRCFMQKFSCKLPSPRKNLKKSRRVIIIIDSRILFHGSLTLLSELIEDYPNASRIWLTRRDTGRFYPEHCENDPDISFELPLDHFILSVHHYASLKTSPKNNNKPNISKEKVLLGFFLLDMDFHRIAKHSNLSIKTLYIHRQRIYRKYHFNSFLHLKFIYGKNKDIFAYKIANE